MVVSVVLRARWLAVAVLGFAAMSFAGCGSTPANGNASAQGGSAGMSGVAGAGAMSAAAGGSGALGNGGAAGAAVGSGGSGDASGGGVSGSMSEGGSAPVDVPAATKACKDYLLAQCTRVAECLSTTVSDSCLAYQQQCPAMFLALGSGYSVDSLAACAEEWKTFSCERVRLNDKPDCIKNGTRAVGQPCRYWTQCASGACSAVDGSACGKCVPAAESGGACVVLRQCPASHLCSYGHCLQIQAWSAEDSLPDGAECTYDGRCTGACARTDAGDRCVPAPDAGEPCLTNVPMAGARRCRYRTYCDPQGICRAAPSSGACAEGLVPCDGANYCDSPTGYAPGTCSAWLTPGAVCNPAVSEVCGENDVCTCDDAACSAAHCVRYAASGAACDQYRRCPAGSACVNAVCAPVSEPFWPADCPVSP